MICNLKEPNEIRTQVNLSEQTRESTVKKSENLEAMRIKKKSGHLQYTDPQSMKDYSEDVSRSLLEMNRY